MLWLFGGCYYFCFFFSVSVSASIRELIIIFNFNMDMLGLWRNVFSQLAIATPPLPLPTDRSPAAGDAADVRARINGLACKCQKVNETKTSITLNKAFCLPPSPTFVRSVARPSVHPSSIPSCKSVSVKVNANTTLA